MFFNACAFAAFLQPDYRRWWWLLNTWSKGNTPCSTGHEVKLRQWPRLRRTTMLQGCSAAANHQPAACNTLILCSGVVCHSNTNHSECSLWISLTSLLTGLERDIVCGTICLMTQRYIKGDLSAGNVFLFSRTLVQCKFETCWRC